MHQELFPDPFLILVNKPKQPYLLKIWYFKRSLSKDLKKVNLLNPVLFNGQFYQNQNRPGTSDQLFFRLKNKFRKTPVLVIYYLIEFDNLI